jgi:F0F1-type ATP synthase membrane subunit b/b'
MEILHKLGELFLESLPTVAVVLLFYYFLRWAFFAPIQKAMSERDQRIQGARVEAAAVEGSARQELDRYNEALRKAREEIYGEQEAARQVALEGRSKLLKAMRARAQEDVEAAKQRIAAEIEVARAHVEAQIPSVAGEIVRRMLETPSSPHTGAAK